MAQKIPRSRRRKRRPAGRRMAVETLENRVVLSALTPGNILVATSNANIPSKLYEFTVDGALVQESDIPSPAGTESPRDLVVDVNGKVQIYNGTFHPDLATWDPATGGYEHREYDGWSTVANLTYGGMTSWGDYVFATDMNTAGREAQGVFRINVQDYTSQRFAPSLEPIDLNVGLDGLLYVLTYSGINGGGSAVHVFDPATMVEQRTVALPRQHRAIDVDANGDIFAVNPDVYHYTPDGVLIGDPYDRGMGGLADIDLDEDGRILIASHGGDIGITDTEFRAWTQFTSRPANGVTFAAFVTPTRGFPKAIYDVFTVDENSLGNSLDVLANDRPETGQSLSIVALGAPSHGGTVSISGGNTVSYAPATEFVGRETFTYTARDSAGRVDKAIVTVQVTAVNTVTAVDDQYSTDEETELDVPASQGLLANDLWGTDPFAGPFDMGNIIATNAPICCEAPQIHEYTPSGTRVREIEIPEFGSVELSRDLVIDRNGDIQIWNGTFDPRLSTYHTHQGLFSHDLFAGWSTANNLTFGGIAAYGDYVFAADNTSGGDTSAERGVVRFNVSDLTVERFGAAEGDVIDVAVGWDNTVYTLVGSGSPIGRAAHAYDPITMQHLRSIPLPSTHRAITADADGNIYGAGRGDGDSLHKYDANGNDLGWIDLKIGGIGDIDITADGRILVASHGGEIALTDTDFSFSSIITGRPSNGVAFAAFVQQPPGRSVGALTVRSNTQPAHGTVSVQSNGAFVYTPDLDFAGVDTFTYVTQDNSGSSAGATVRITVNNRNDAPRLTAGGPDRSTDEDSFWVAPLGQLINGGVGTTTIVDVDAGDDLGGVAVAGSTGTGTWSYSLDGNSFDPIGQVSGTSARLLPRDSLLKYVPAGDRGGVATLQYFAWDATAGTGGQLADVSARGGATAFSADGDTMTLSVADVNDAPALAPAAPDMGQTDEDTPIVVALADFVTGIQDPDPGAIIGGIAITASTGNGSWRFSLDGVQFQDLPPATIASARLLPRTGRLQYLPDGKNGELPTVTYRAWDTTIGTAGQTADTRANGGTTAFSLAQDTATLRVSDVNDAPQLTAVGPQAGTTDEDTPINVQLVDFVTGINDVDTGATVGGVALVASTGAGQWWYSVDGGTYLPVPAVGAGSSLLLDRDDWIRYVPDGDNSESATIGYRAWDQTSGNAGETVSTVVNGGTTAFSIATDAAALDVAPANDAPVLTAATPDMGSTDEETVFRVQLSHFVTGIQDVDRDALVGGIAITGTAEEGTWSYSLDGSSFTAIGAVSPEQSLLLEPDDWLQYTPSGIRSESAAAQYRAWDQTANQAGEKVSTQIVGGSSPFSVGIDTATLTVNEVNDAPTLIAARPERTTDEDTPISVSLGDLINQGATTTQIHDVDRSAVIGSVALTQATGGGQWQFSLDGTIFNPVGTVSDATARLLPPQAHLKYLPAGDRPETAALTFRAWDATVGQAGGTGDASQQGGSTPFSTATEELKIRVTSLNDAPVLTVAEPTQQTDENQSILFSVGSFVNNGPLTTPIVDVDPDAVAAGIALVSTSGNGPFFYSLNGTQFLSLGTVNTSSALLLPPTASLRFFPSGENGQTATVTFLGWDRTIGADGDRIDATSTGGTSSLSNTADTLSIVVRDVNDAPTGLSLDPAHVDENRPAATVGQVTVEDPDNNDQHTLTTNDSRFVIENSTLRLADGVTLNHELTPTIDLEVTATDSGQLQVTRSVTISVNDLPDAPEVNRAIMDQEGFATLTFTFDLPADTFTDEDVGDSLTLESQLADGTALPGWLEFQAGQGRFTGIPAVADAGSIDIRVTATDLTARSVSDVFTLTIDDNPFPWRNPRNALDVDNSGKVFPLDALIIINYLNEDSTRHTLPEAPAAPPPFYDVSGDNMATPLDALQVINFLNNPAGGEGEAEFSGSAGLPGLPRPTVSRPLPQTDGTSASTNFNWLDRMGTDWQGMLWELQTGQATKRAEYRDDRFASEAWEETLALLAGDTTDE